MRPAALLPALLVLALLLSAEPASARARKKMANPKRPPLQAVRPALPAKRLVVRSHLPGAQSDALLTVFHKHKASVVDHYSELVSNTQVMDIKALVDAHKVGDASAAPFFKLCGTCSSRSRISRTRSSGWISRRL